MRHRHPRRVAAIAAGIGLAVPVAAACAAGSTGTTDRAGAQSKSASAPALTLTSRDPVSVAGRHFSPRLKVHLIVHAGATQSRTVRPNRHGAFTAAFTAVIDRCTNWSVSAAQTGHAPVMIRGARPQCPPAGAP